MLHESIVCENKIKRSLNVNFKEITEITVKYFIEKGENPKFGKKHIDICYETAICESGTFGMDVLLIFDKQHNSRSSIIACESSRSVSIYDIKGSVSFWIKCDGNYTAQLDIIGK